MSTNKHSFSHTHRIYYLDYLRIFATISVITIHISAMHWYTEPIQSFNWKILNIYNSAVSYAVPLFVMISGSLWLSNDHINFRKLFTKNIVRIITSFLFWSFLYAILHTIIIPICNNQEIFVKDFFIEWLTGRYHLWFCFMIIGLYMILPIIKRICEHDTLLSYVLCIFFIFTFLIPTIQVLPSLNWITKIANNMNLSLGSQYTFYFMLGFYLYKTNINKMS